MLAASGVQKPCLILLVDPREYVLSKLLIVFIYEFEVGCSGKGIFDAVPIK
jgi:hypothetical protein